MAVICVGSLFLSACSSPNTSVNTAAQKGSAVTNTLRLAAPQPALDLWKKWNGKYQLFAHKSSGIKEFNDLNGKQLSCAFINAENIIGDATEFIKAGGVNMVVGIQNTVDMYGKQFLEDPNAVGLMTPDVAKHYKFESNDRLVQITFE